MKRRLVKHLDEIYIVDYVENTELVVKCRGAKVMGNCKLEHLRVLCLN